MKYYAIWYSSANKVRIFEVDDAGNEEVLHEESAHDHQIAAEFVKEQGFGFTDLWTHDSKTFNYQAPLKAM